MSSPISPLCGRRIAVLCGGPLHCTERDVSLLSGEQVHLALCEVGAKAFIVDIVDDTLSALLEHEDKEHIDICFLALHGAFGEDGTVQQLLTERRAFYTGDGEAASALAFNKICAKRRLLDCGIATPQHSVLHRGDDHNFNNVPFRRPIVVKVPCSGSSIGVRVVHDEREWAAALRDGFKRGQCDELLLEQFVPGRELTVGILGTAALPVLEIKLPSADAYFSAEMKAPALGDKTSSAPLTRCPADLPDSLAERVQRLALDAHKAMGLEVYSRVDIRLEEDTNEPFVLDINTIPGMTKSSLLPKAALSAGYSLAALCAEIVHLSSVHAKSQ